LLLGIRLAVGVDAYLLRRHHNAGKRPSPLHIGALVILLTLAAAPHLLVVRYAAAQLDLLDEVFDATSTEAARPTALASNAGVPAATTTTARPALSPPASPPATAASPTTPTTAPLTAPPTTPSTAPPTSVPTWDGDERLTILLLGGDGGFDRSGVRTDTIIALSIEVATGDAVAFSIPRNWQRMQFPLGTPAAERFPEGYVGLTNELYNLGLRYPDAFPGAESTGGASIKQAVAQLLGTPVHYYALVDMVGVVNAIDLFGGVDVTVTEWIDDDIKPIVPNGPRLIIQTRPGDYHFDGLTALAYMRARTTSSDYHRMSRQRCVVGALIDQVGVTTVLANYPALADIIGSHLETDIPLDRLPELLDVAARLDTDRIVTLNFIPPDYPRGNAPIEIVRAAAIAAFNADIETPLEVLDLACRN
ncbi:MAG: LCP family protein, partial [Actinomycetota bacterium]|nr:LCP family protein [Actinomycetota bacterium]